MGRSDLGEVRDRGNLPGDGGGGILSILSNRLLFEEENELMLACRCVCDDEDMEDE